MSIKQRALEQHRREMEAAGSQKPPVSDKVQTAGAAARLEMSVASIGIERVARITLAEIKIPDGYHRDPSEFETAEFKDLVESIKATKGNLVPIDVREVNRGGRVHYDLIAGTRRLEACRQAGRPEVLANVRIMDDRKADILHDVENAKRAEKRPFSLALQLKHMMASGRYATQAELADALGRSAGTVSQSLSLIDKAPEGFWGCITDPASISPRDAAVLVKAFQKPAFLVYAKSLAPKSTPAATLMKRVSELLARPRAEAAAKTLADKVIEKKRGKDYIFHIPGDVPSDVRLKALKLIRELVSSASS